MCNQAKGEGGRESKQARLNFVNIDDVGVAEMQDAARLAT
jgi:hypothetical protein